MLHCCLGQSGVLHFFGIVLSCLIWSCIVLHIVASSCPSEGCGWFGPSTVNRCARSMVWYLFRIDSMIMAIGYSFRISSQYPLCWFFGRGSGLCWIVLTACAKGELQAPDPLAGVRLWVRRIPSVSGLILCFLCFGFLQAILWWC